MDLAHIPHTCNEENKSFGVIPDLQLFRHTHKLIYLNGRGHDRKYTKLMTVTLNVIQKKNNVFCETMHRVYSQCNPIRPSLGSPDLREYKQSMTSSNWASIIS